MTELYALLALLYMVGTVIGLRHMHRKWKNRRITPKRLLAFWDDVLDVELAKIKNPSVMLTTLESFRNYYECRLPEPGETTFNVVLLRFAERNTDFHHLVGVGECGVITDGMFNAIFMEWLELDPKCHTHVLNDSLTVALSNARIHYPNRLQELGVL